MTSKREGEAREVIEREVERISEPPLLRHFAVDAWLIFISERFARS